MTTSHNITTEEFDRRFDAGEDVLEYIDLSKLERPLLKKDRVNVDLPRWLIQKLDRYAQEKGVPRQSLIKLWLAERAAEEAA